MADQKKFIKRPEFLSPRCVSAYPKLLVPDTKYNAEGMLSVKLIMTEEQVDVIRGQAKPIMEAYIADDLKESKGATLKSKQALGGSFDFSIAPQMDGDTETGNFEVTFKQKAKLDIKDGKGGVKKKDIHIPLFDAKGTPIVTHAKDGTVLPSAPEIWGGTEMKVRYQIIPAWIASSKRYHATLRPVAIQILKLVSGSGKRSASELGFEAEEGGFEATAPNFNDMPTETPGGDGSDY